MEEFVLIDLGQRGRHPPALAPVEVAASGPALPPKPAFGTLLGCRGRIGLGGWGYHAVSLLCRPTAGGLTASRPPGGRQGWLREIHDLDAAEVHRVALRLE
jgi:hypothetical protein